MFKACSDGLTDFVTSAVFNEEVSFEVYLLKIMFGLDQSISLRIPPFKAILVF